MQSTRPGAVRRLVLAAGAILALLFSGLAKLTFAVTGGTGHFSGTGGHVDITPTTHRGEEAALLTFHLKH
ncbi:hypothetical protein H3146_20725 [Streptomyces sp. OF3]|uniref:Uncharacterized protein n=1 Tax=Streptomyces alkaliterrae TaxID=2213162 RepID=A0A7W3WNZ8_9ACTN|nr:hypothetical protein [Streptomyces alkaliterrae]MBB1255764.1 hypothetical protein [Streptomyces alkaliterrae]